ncbi:hypothetical protein LOTGIDRAFT_135415, partial [Lottia gigantea]
FSDLIDKGDTLYILTSVHQELCAPAQERVNFLPHYDTIVKGGMYEYYASEGQNPLPYAFAELIDNALAATANNSGERNIQIRLHFDENTNKNSIVFIDNGKGMTPRQLNNWAIYRLSKFIRRDKHVDLSLDHAPRYMNSDISYFGVGGKQAIFFIGNNTRMITKPLDSKDVHELNISKEEFEQREKNNESIYSGYIYNRKPGDTTHLTSDDEILTNLIKEEKESSSFTAVVIQGINTAHIPYLKHNMIDWCRQLTHIYHFYLHGPNGNVFDNEREEKNKILADYFNNIHIEVSLYNRDKPPKTINLRTIEDDMQTQYIRAATSTFMFKACVDGSSVVEGEIRYHPFMFDKETYPTDNYRLDAEPEDDHGYAINDRPARGRRPMFECYWNGRLIPYTLIQDFEWCTEPKKIRNIPVECYNRISGVLWTSDRFQVSTNKLTFLDLEMKLRDKTTSFFRVVDGHERRTNIQKEFSQWLKECHEEYDKQILFTGFKGHVTRADMPKQKQFPWSVFDQVEWDGKVYKQGQLVRILRTLPTLMGTIKRFLLFGDYDGDVYSTGGDIELFQEPRSLYDEVKIVPLSKLDRSASQTVLKKYTDEEEAKLPDHLVVSWPDGQQVINNEKRFAGRTIGAIKVEIANKKGEYISKLPGTSVGAKKLLIELKVIWHSSNGDEVIVSHISQHGKNWPYWFRKMENIKNLGAHTLLIQSVLNESGATKYAGRELPSHKIRFNVIEAEPEKFSVGVLDGPFRVGVPFQIPLEMLDKFNHVTKPNGKLKPSLEASGLEINYGGTVVKGNVLIIKDVVAVGPVSSHTGKNYNLSVKIPELEEDTQSIKIRLLPGQPQMLMVKPEEELEIENGQSATFYVEVHDAAGNVTTEGKQILLARFSGATGMPSYSIDVSKSGSGNLTGDVINVKKIKDVHYITAKIDIQGHKDVKTVERKVKVIPSSRVAEIKVYRDDNDDKKTIKSGDVIIDTVGHSIKNLTFQLLDEGGREITLTDKLLSKIKINWLSKCNKELLSQGKLPDIKIPLHIGEPKYCQIHVIDGAGVEFEFSVGGESDEESQLKVWCNGKPSVQLGEVLEDDILVTIKDKHNNDITKLINSKTCPDIKVTSKNFSPDCKIQVVCEDKKFVIRGIQFENTAMGNQEVEVTWKDLTERIMINVTAGPPNNLQVLDMDIQQPIIVYTDSTLPTLKLQLIDAGGNPCKLSGIRLQLAKDTKIKFSPVPQSVKTNASGQAEFSGLVVTAAPGVYEIQPKAFLQKGMLSGPRVRISVQSDPTRAFELTVDYNKSSEITVGQTLPDFCVKVLNEEGGMLSTASASHLSMKQWRYEHGASSMPSKSVSIPPDSNRSHDKLGVFNFKKRKTPEKSGKYNIMFVYFDSKHEVFSPMITLDVYSGPAVELSPVDSPGIPTVSNTSSTSSRLLIRSLKLLIKDAYGNLKPECEGEVTVSITGGVSEIPVFVGNSGSTELSLKLISGVCTLQNILLQENCPGKDGYEYNLECRVTSLEPGSRKQIPPYNIPFLFYNDAKKQSQMAMLSKQRDNLQNEIRLYKSTFNMQQQLVDEMRVTLQEASKKEQEARSELKRQNIADKHLTVTNSLDKLIASRLQERDQLLSTPRRMCGLATGPTGPEVLGKIGHLALVDNDDIARVLSWHMSADMDCIVTHSSKKAKEIYRDTSGRQQVLPLDSIYRRSLPDWSKPLPHCRHRPNWKPGGNPRYARDMLIFPKDEASCKIVFGMLLGDTLILDTLDYANTYRTEIVQNSHCPTILTVDGDRIRSNGKFGGTMNKALPISKLRGAVFGQSLPMAYHALCTQIDAINNYKDSYEYYQKCKRDLQEQLDVQKLPEMTAKYKECEAAEEKLKSLEQKLGKYLCYF